MKYNPFVYLAVLLINLYQKTLSPDHGFFKVFYPYGYCKFHPSCSQYAKEAIVKHGLVYGSVLGGKRILKCNPFTSPKIDTIK